MPKITLDETATIDRRKASRRNDERRTDADAEFQGEEQRIPTTTRRKKVERRRQIDPTTCERDYSGSEIEFMTAMDEYKRKSGRQFPTWSEVLEVIHCLGYRQIAEPTVILPNGV